MQLRSICTFYQIHHSYWSKDRFCDVHFMLSQEFSSISFNCSLGICWFEGKVRGTTAHVQCDCVSLFLKASKSMAFLGHTMPVAFNYSSTFFASHERIPSNWKLNRLFTHIYFPLRKALITYFKFYCTVVKANKDCKVNDYLWVVYPTWIAPQRVFHFQCMSAGRLLS